MFPNQMASGPMLMFPAQLTSGTPARRPPTQMESGQGQGQGGRYTRLIDYSNYFDWEAASMP